MQLNSIEPYSCFVLSIQYVYELLLILFLRLSLKAGAKVQPLFLISKLFEKKN